MNINQILFSANFRYLPNKYIFGGIGATMLYTYNSEFTHEKELLTKIAVLSTGEVIKLGINPLTGSAIEGSTSNKAILEKSKYPNVEMPFFINIAIGANIELNKRLTISPVITYYIPLTPFSTYIEDTKINMWKFGLQLNYKFSENKQ